MPIKLDGKKIKRLRELAGMDQPALARACGCCISTISNIERAANGCDSVRLRLCYEIAAALGKPFEGITGTFPRRP